MAQITSVTSESLQAKIRELLPSQQGFGEDLQAQNVIVPIVDLTAAAEGSDVPLYQQQAIAFGSQTAFDVSNTTTVIANTAGFYRIFGVASVRNGNVDTNASFTMTDGLTSKKIWSVEMYTDTTVNYGVVPFDFTVFLASGESISATTNSVVANMIGSVRQTATVNGVAVNPSGFSPQ